MPDIGEVDSIEITVLVEETVGYDTRFVGQHGISLLLDVRSGDIHKKVLMDTGQDSGTILHNASILGLDLASIDMLFISHCHEDHTGGLAGLLRAMGKKEVLVIAHPTISRPTYLLKPYLRRAGLTHENSEETIKELGAYLVLVKQPFELLPGLFSTGEVQRTTEFETCAVGCTIQDGSWVEDQMLDDMSLIANVKGRGLVVATGCGHAGIVNILRHSIEVTGIERIEGIVGGFHLVDASEQRIQDTVDALAEIDPAWVLTGHCTGAMACRSVASKFGDKFDLLHSGVRIVVDSTGVH